MKAKNLFGRLLYGLIGKHLPASSSPVKIGQKKFRAFCGRLILKKCGKNVNIEKGAVFTKNVSLGNNSGIGLNCRVGNTVTIGDDVMMGPDCVILTRNHNYERTDIPMNMQGYSKEKPVMIGNDVWIGTRAIILEGVNIGNHCIIGAGSVVTHDVNDYEIVAGAPARVIRVREHTEAEK